MSKTTADNWQITISLDHASINSVPNMAAAAVVREGFVSATAHLQVDDVGVANPAMKVRTGLNVFTEIGCQVDLSGGGNIQLDTTFASSLPTLDLTPSADDVSLSPTAAVSPQFTVNMKPGNITDPPLGSVGFPPPPDFDNGDSVVTDPLTVSVQDFHIKINNCAGPVAIRFRILGTIATAGSYDTVEAFSNILPL